MGSIVKKQIVNEYVHKNNCITIINFGVQIIKIEFVGYRLFLSNLVLKLK